MTRLGTLLPCLLAAAFLQACCAQRNCGTPRSCRSVRIRSVPPPPFQRIKLSNNSTTETATFSATIYHNGGTQPLSLTLTPGQSRTLPYNYQNVDRIDANVSLSPSGATANRSITTPPCNDKCAPICQSMNPPSEGFVEAGCIVSSANVVTLSGPHFWLSDFQPPPGNCFNPCGCLQIAKDP